MGEDRQEGSWRLAWQLRREAVRAAKPVSSVGLLPRARSAALAACDFGGADEASCPDVRAAKRLAREQQRAEPLPRVHVDLRPAPAAAQRAGVPAVLNPGAGPEVGAGSCLVVQPVVE